MNQIKVSNLTKNYQTGKVVYEVLKGIDFSIDDGEFVSICGPSGSGKTTLLYVLGGLEPYTSGSISVFEKELNTYTDSQLAKMRSQDIGFVFQFYNLIPNLTVFENIMLSSVLGSNKSKEEILKILQPRINKVYHLDSILDKNDRLIIHINAK